MTTRKESMTTSPERVDARAARLTEAIAERIRDAMGDITQRALAKRLGYSSGSTVSAHLNGHTNLTLKTVVRYAVALDAEIVVVPDVKRPKKRRRHRGRARRVSEQRKSLVEIDLVKRKLHALLSDLTARIGQIIEAADDLSQRELARRMQRDEAYVSRALAGGVNLTLKTIAAFEVALNTHLLNVDGHGLEDISGSYRTYGTVPSLRSSNDGGYCFDHAGVVTRAVTYSKYILPAVQSPETDEQLEAA